VKNQYFGDVKDYLKYGLLRCFASSGLELGVLWLLTRDDGSSDGSDRRYLEQPSWREHDPALYDFLKATCAKPSGRMVSNLETSGLLNARYFSEFIPELDVARESAFERAGEALAGSHLLFFDPDVGVEVKSTAYGARGSSRYVYWRELEAAWENGTSLLIYQHFPRQEHAVFAARMAEEVRSHAPAATVYTLASQDVVYLLAVQPSHKSNVDFALKLLEDRFGRYFIITELEPAVTAPPPAAPAPRTLPKYHIDVYWSDRDDGWIANVPDLENCAALGKTPEEAVGALIPVLQRWFDTSVAEGAFVPEPTYRSAVSSG